MTQSFFKIYKCVKLGDGLLHFSQDYTFICFEGRHAAFAALTGLLIMVVTIGVPAGVGILIFRAHRRNDLYHKLESTKTTAAHERPARSMRYLGPMFISYHRDAKYFEVVIYVVSHLSCCVTRLRLLNSH